MSIPFYWRRHATFSNGTVTFNDNLIMAAGVDGVAELPFLGTPIPPLTAALDTIYWQATVEIWPSCVQY